MMSKTNPQIILVMGVTGVGKSTFIKHATGSNVEVGHGQSSCTADVKCFQIPQTNVYLMDTPGFDDTYISDADILKEIATSLVDAFNDKAEIQGALYIHPVIEARMRGSGRKNLIMFRKVLGMKGMRNVRLVTTKWSQVDPDKGREREEELCQKEEFWQPLLAAGASAVRFDDSMESAIEIIKPLIHGPAFEPQLVEEVVRDGKPLSQTQAGKVVNDDIAEARKLHKAEMEQLARDMKEAGNKRDFAFRAELAAERDEHAKKLKKLEDDSRVIAAPVQRTGRFGRWVARTAAIAVGGAATFISGGLLAGHALLLYGATEAAISDD
ncbi:P-loop containing nucleoside triphosphate hydrolase protein [Leptodontidium sp. MPI-SDFR-AT-0119]|nr:P-loop containing nucleoside triphosphate hydrolase protein [Leptodontidium sp. MPI-SDFR-AT-0119]